MVSLATRPRVRRAVERVALRALHVVGWQAPQPAAPPPPDPPAPQSPPYPLAEHFARALEPGRLAVESNAATMRLFETLDDSDVAEVEQHIAQDDEAAAHYANAASQYVRCFLLLTYGLWFEVPAVIEKTRLTSAQPPEDVHAMARGALAAAGGLYEADLVVDALVSGGAEMGGVARVLDFGCSSGRVLRVLHAAYPGIALQGCDPNDAAIGWATANLPGIDFLVNGDRPPLPLQDASLDLAYAISIWSHFAPRLGLSWFEEMHRLIRPGGHLVCTTHGLTSVAFYAKHELRTPAQSKEIADALYDQGWWYKAEFGEEGDWGVINPEWGTAFLSPEWMLTQLCPHWRVLEFAPGRNQYNQDVYVLERA